MRARLALFTTRLVNGTSRRLGRGQGTVAGGRAGLRVDPLLLQHLTSSVGREVALVTGTNGKTTTTRLLAVAWAVGGDPVVSNETGSNMPPGHVAALAGERHGRGGGRSRSRSRSRSRAVLEVDEIYLPRVIAATKPATVVLLNLSRDQLDRTNEVRMVAGRWRAALAAAPHTTVVANCDDPLVAWGAGAAARVCWVAAGMNWQLDAVGCPSCDGRIRFGSDGWLCEAGCGLTRPTPTASLVTDADGTARGIWSDGRTVEIALTLPGRFNQANALMAAVAAEQHGIAAADSLAAMAGVGEVAGRFTDRRVGGVPARLMLAKNPAGWSELLTLVDQDRGPVVVAINARTADGADPSWLWDVPFEVLRGRAVVATGDRCRDLSVRLHYAEVAHTMEIDSTAAVGAAAALAAQSASATEPGFTGRVDVIGNYTAFNDLLRVGVVPSGEMAQPGATTQPGEKAQPGATAPTDEVVR